MGENVMVLLPIYGARDIFLLFYNHSDTESEWQEMRIGVAGPIFAHKKINRSMRQQYTYHNIWEKHIVAIIHINGTRVIFLLLYDNQDTESQSWDIRIDVSGPILTHKNVKASMGQQYKYHTRWEKKCCNSFFLELEPFFYYLVITKTLGLCHLK